MEKQTIMVALAALIFAVALFQAFQVSELAGAIGNIQAKAVTGGTPVAQAAAQAPAQSAGQAASQNTLNDYSAQVGGC